MESGWIEKALAFGRLGRHKVAIHCLDRALESDERDVEAWFYKGLTLEKLGRHDESIKCYDRALDINPFYAKAWYNKGAVLGNFGNYRKALRCFEEAHRQGHLKAGEAIDACKSELKIYG